LLHARAFQQAILSTPPPVVGHDVGVTYRPLDDVGGDIYDVAMVNDEVVRLFIADATGHGVPAALVTMLLKGAYESVKRMPGSPAAVLGALNDRVASTSASLDAIFTAVVLDFDLTTRTIQYTCGGHPPPLLAKARGEVEELESGGAIVGIALGMEFPSFERGLEPEDGLYLVTDGIVESRRATGEFFGDARLHRAVAEANVLATGVGDAILARLDSWLKPSKPDDDVTIIAFRPARSKEKLLS
jgi:sigma-B regulation protein RsbU (phosphoserine phosphatase)